MDSKYGGNNALEKKYGESGVRTNVNLTPSQREFLIANGGIAQNIRSLVDAAIDNLPSKLPENLPANFIHQLVDAVVRLKANGYGETDILDLLRHDLPQK